MRHAIYCQSSHRCERHTSQSKIREYGFTQAAFLVVIFHGNEFAAGRTNMLGERRSVEGLDAVKIEHADADSARSEFVVSLESFVNRHSRANHGDAIISALPQHL